MGARSFVVVALMSSVGLFACGGGAVASGEPKSADDPWKDFKGTYATSAAPSVGKAEKSESKKAHAEAKAKAEAEPAEAAPAPAKKTSKTLIKGESLSSLGVDTLADVSKGALKTKVVSSKVTVGAQYEQVQVTLKGATVQIIRPAASPDASGPAIGSPKAKNDGLSKTEAGWYDEEADVLLVVNAPKKAGAQKALGAILSR